MSNINDDIKLAVSQLTDATNRADEVTKFIDAVATGDKDTEVTNPGDPSKKTPTIQKMFSTKVDPVVEGYENSSLKEIVTLTEVGQVDVNFKTAYTVNAIFFVNGPRVTDSKLEKDIDFEVVSGQQIQLKRSYPVGTTISVFQNINKNVDNITVSVEDKSITNRPIVEVDIGNLYAQYEDEVGRKLYPRAHWNNNWYLPTNDDKTSVTFINIPVDNGDGTITVETDDGFVVLSKIKAETLTRKDLEDHELAGIAVANNVPVSQVAYLSIGPKTNALYFYHLDSGITYRANTPITAEITAVGAPSGDLLTIVTSTGDNIVLDGRLGSKYAKDTVNSHNMDEDAHPGLMTAITQQVQIATTAADAASLSANFFETVTEGMNNTSIGEYFHVPSEDTEEYVILYKHGVTLPEEIKRYPNSGALETIRKLSWFNKSNVIEYGDFVYGSPQIRSNSPIVNLTKQVFTDSGIDKGIQWLSNKNEYVVQTLDRNINNEYVAGLFIVHSENATNLLTSASIYSRSSDGTLSGLIENNGGFEVIDTDTRLVWYTGKVSDINAEGIVIGSPNVPVDNTRFATNFYVTVSKSPINIKDIFDYYMDANRARYQIRKLMASMLTDSYVQGVVDNTIDDMLEKSYANDVQHGDFIFGIPVIRSGSTISNINDKSMFTRGLSRGIQWRSGSEYIKSEIGEYHNKYVFGGFYVTSENQANLFKIAQIYSDYNGVLTNITDITNGYIEISPTCYYVWAKGRVNDINAQRVIVGSAISPVDSTRFASGFSIISSEVDIDINAAIRNVQLADKVRFPSLINSYEAFKLSYFNNSNECTFGDFFEGDPEFRSNSQIVDLNIKSLLAMGIKRGINWKVSNNEYIIQRYNQNVVGKHFLGIYTIYSENSDNLFEDSSAFTSNVNDVIGSINLIERDFIDIDANTRVLWIYGSILQADAENILIGSTFLPQDDSLYASNFYIYTSDDTINFHSVVDYYLDANRARALSIQYTMDMAKTSYVDQEILKNIDGLLDQPMANEFEHGDFVGGDPLIRSNSPIVDLTQHEFLKRGIRRGIQWRVGGNEYAISQVIEELHDKHLFCAFFAHSTNATNLAQISNPSIYTTDIDGNNLTSPTIEQKGFIPISDNFNLYWTTVIVNDIDAKKVLIGSTKGPIDATFFASGFYLVVDDTSIEPTNAIRSLLVADKIRPQVNPVTIVPDPEPELLPSGPYINLDGYDGYSEVIGYQGTDKIKRIVRPFHSPGLESSQVFNFYGDYINDNIVKTGGDDVAPYRAMGVTIGANHGYFMGEFSANAHGKTQADIGSKYALNGVEYVIVGIKDSNKIFMINTATNIANEFGTFTHVSGGVNIDDIVTTSVSQEQLYTPAQNRKIECIVDGKVISETTGIFEFSEYVAFRESYDILGRDQNIQYYIDNGSSGVPTPSGMDPSFTVSMTYMFDINANCTIYTDFLALKSIELQDIMFVQAARQELTEYYFPKAIPFTQNSVDFDYANIEPANKVSSSGVGNVYFYSNRAQPDGLFMDRVIGLNSVSNSCFAMGYLPVQDTSIENRRVNASYHGWEIRGNTDKLYPRAIEQDVITLNPGDYFSTIAYRNVYTKPADMTGYYPVRTKSDDYFYCDWHNIDKLVRFNIPDDFAGRDFEIVEKSDNVTLHSKALTNSLTATVNSPTGNAYLILKILK